MSKSNAYENLHLRAVLWGDSIPGISQNHGTPLTHLQLAFHTDDPGEGGDQETNECNYTGYTRLARARNNTEFAISGNTATLVNNGDFPTCTAGPQTGKFWSLGVAASGPSMILYSGPVTPNVAILVGGFPRLKAGTSIVED